MKKYQLAPTSDLKLHRIVDNKGDWTHYFAEDTGQTLRAVNMILNRGFAKGPQFMEAMKNSTAKDWEEKMEKAGDRGDAVHQAVAMSIGGGVFRASNEVLAEDNKTRRPLSDDEQQAVLSFAQLWNDHGMIAVQYEKSVKNLEVGYSGTLDLLAVMTTTCGNRYCKCASFVGKLGLWDHKSGKGIYESYGPQLAAYSKADLKALTDRKIEYTAIDHLGRDTERGYKIEFYDEVETEAHWKEFLAADVIMRATYRPFNWLTDNEEIPDEVELGKFEEESITISNGRMSVAVQEIKKPKAIKKKVVVKRKRFSRVEALKQQLK